MSWCQCVSVSNSLFPPCSITQSQHQCLSSLALSHLFAALRLFVDWAEDGWYDFCSLPFGTKSPMSLPDEEAISKISENFDGELEKRLSVWCSVISLSLSLSLTHSLAHTHTGTPNQLLHSLKTLVDVLIHMENTIIKAVTTKSQCHVRTLVSCNMGEWLILSLLPHRTPSSGSC